MDAAAPQTTRARGLSTGRPFAGIAGLVSVELLSTELLLIALLYLLSCYLLRWHLLNRELHFLQHLTAGVRDGHRPIARLVRSLGRPCAPRVPADLQRDAVGLIIYFPVHFEFRGSTCNFQPQIDLVIDREARGLFRDLAILYAFAELRFCDLQRTGRLIFRPSGKGGEGHNDGGKGG